METASCNMTWNRGECRVQIRGQVDEQWLETIAALVPADRHLHLDLRWAHLSPSALGALTRLARSRPQLSVEPGRLLPLRPRQGPPPAPSPQVDIAAVLAHELRAPLTLAHTRLQLLARALLQAHLVSEAQACRRTVADLTDTMRLFDLYLSAAQPWSCAPVPLGATVEATVQALGGAEGLSLVRFRVQADAGALVSGHPQALHQLVHNLILNAAQACAGGGEVLISVEREPPWVTLRVRDSGDGFAPGVLQEPFVPFRSHRQRGTGLGLTICKWIVDRHHGTIHLQNPPEGGALVEVQLPAWALQAPAARAASPGATAAVGGAGNAAAALPAG